MMFLAYMKYGELKDKKLHPNTEFAIIGKDSEEIFKRAEKYGTDPYFIRGMFELNKDWA